MDTLNGGRRPSVASAAHATPVPPAAPLSMPTQDLDAPASAASAGQRSLRTFAARLTTFGGTLALVLMGLHQMISVVGSDGITRFEWCFVVLFVLTIAWIALSACAALTGVLFGESSQGAEKPMPLACRHVLVMPVYNEDASATSAALETMGRALCKAGVSKHFELFILSDTTDAETWIRETACVDRLRRRLGRRLPVWYRHREDNTGRKAGNVRDFVERWGARYESMLLLDADSLLRADTIIEMARRMEADQTLGILQSVPLLAGGHSLLARLQQFSGSVYGPVIARGISAWQGDDGNYWGHNAMIRVRALAAAGGLPSLPGRRPLGGDILSHDFVEAALLRKAGWRVCMAPELEGSWENSPPSLLDVAIRDRRWAQGNIQHLAVLSRRGIAWPNRMHLLMGVMSYVISPLWLGLIGIGLCLSIQAALVQHDYFPNQVSLFPDWPSFDSERMIALFVYTFVLLLVPKLIGVATVLSNRERRARYCGGPRFCLSALLELLMSALYAPIMMLIQSRQLWQIVRGQDSGWSLQARSGERLPWRVAVHHHVGHMLVGIAVLTIAVMVDPSILPWVMPIIVGLVLAIPLSRGSGSSELGLWLRRERLLSSPCETEPPGEFLLRDQLAEQYRSATGCIRIVDVLADPVVRERHARNVVTQAHRQRGRPNSHLLVAESKLVEADSIDEALEWLSEIELMQVLGNTRLIRHFAIDEVSA